MNNEVLQNIRTRRSCRAYTAQPVEPEKLKAIVEAGTWAASGMGRQAPKIVVLTDPAEIAELERMNAAVLGNPAAHPFYGAPVVCVVLTDPEVSTCVEDGALVILCEDRMTYILAQKDETLAVIREQAAKLNGGPIKVRVREAGDEIIQESNAKVDELIGHAQELDIEIKTL